MTALDIGIAISVVTAIITAVLFVADLIWQRRIRALVAIREREDAREARLLFPRTTVSWVLEGRSSYSEIEELVGHKVI